MNGTAAIRSARRQRGVVLIIAMIALVAISLAGIALMRSVDTGLVITGNLAFKQTVAQAGDAGTEAAVAWLEANAAALNGDVPAAGYYATWRAGCDLLGIATLADQDDDVVWKPNDPAKANCGMIAAAVASADLPSGYSATYVINRLCTTEAPPGDSGNYCNPYQSASSGSESTKGGVSYGQSPLSGVTQQYYRITTRIEGPRNTESVVQSIVAF